MAKAQLKVGGGGAATTRRVHEAHPGPTNRTGVAKQQSAIGSDEGLKFKDETKALGALDAKSPLAAKARDTVTAWYQTLDTRGKTSDVLKQLAPAGLSIELTDPAITSGKGFGAWYEGWKKEFAGSWHEVTIESMRQVKGGVEVTLFSNTNLMSKEKGRVTLPQRQVVTLQQDAKGQLRLQGLKFDAIDLRPLGGPGPSKELSPGPSMFAAAKVNLTGVEAAKPPPSGKLGADVMVEVLRKNGYQWVSFNPGASEEVASSALEKSAGMHPVLAYQELSAMGFAGGVALAGLARRSTGDKEPQRAAVIAHGQVGQGGLDSFITGFAQQRLPVLILIGNAGVNEDAMQRHQNPNGMLEMQARAAGAKEVLMVTSPDQLAEQIARATALAERGTPGPVAVFIPQNGVMAAPVTKEAVIEQVPVVDNTGRPGAQMVAELAGKLAAAKNPVILVGDEIARTGGVEALVKLAEQTGAKVIGSMSHELNFPMNHPLWSGSTGHLFGEAQRKLLSDADVVVSVGGPDLSAVFPTNDAPYSAQAWVTYVGTDPGAAAQMYRTSTAPMMFDPKSSLEALSAELDKSMSPAQKKAAQGRLGQLGEANEKARQQRIANAKVEAQRVPLHAYEVMQAAKEVIDELGLKDKVVIFNEGLTRAQAVEDLMQPDRPNQYYSSQGGSLGYSGTMASGFAAADPDKIVLAFSGDGGFMYTPQWLLTAQEQGLNVKSVVFKDERYSLLDQAAGAQGRSTPDVFQLGGRRRDVKRQASVDFVKLAEAMGGVQSDRVASRDGLKAAFRRLLTSDGPALLEADTPVVPPPDR